MSVTRELFRFLGELARHNDRTWFDMAGNYHSDALRVTERYTLLNADTIRYEEISRAGHKVEVIAAYDGLEVAV